MAVEMARVQIIETATAKVVAQYSLPPTETISLESDQPVVLADVVFGDPADLDVIIEIIDGQHVRIILENGTSLLIENFYAFLADRRHAASR